MFLRFGEIPENERSINWMKVKFDDQRDFEWALESHSFEDALGMIRNLEDVLESGLSVFEIDQNYNPVLSNEKLQKSYNSRLGKKKMYLVDGDVVGTGQDGEPLIRNVKIIKEF